jgi:hypothetical protein
VHRFATDLFVKKVFATIHTISDLVTMKFTFKSIPLQPLLSADSSSSELFGMIIPNIA